MLSLGSNTFSFHSSQHHDSFQEQQSRVSMLQKDFKYFHSQNSHFKYQSIKLCHTSILLFITQIFSVICWFCFVFHVFKLHFCFAFSICILIFWFLCFVYIFPLVFCFPSFCSFVFLFIFCFPFCLTFVTVMSFLWPIKHYMV